ncbi:MAG: hypothetical protein U9Q22_03375 [Candidatus Altiarchaeota archaeon]|nr:hypothetical protein [Candidatus Altiarchaeota archaeon]
MKLKILVVITILVLACGCTDFRFPWQEKKKEAEPTKPQVPISKGGLTSIGLKKYTETNVGNKTDFIFRLKSDRIYFFRMEYVDELQTTKKGGTTRKFVKRYKKVDYDLFLMDNNESLLKGSTQSAGLREAILFSPEKTGKYLLRVLNDKRESKGSWPVFIISAEYYKKGESNRIQIKGKDMKKQKPGYETYYALWLRKSPYSSVHIDVPPSLDMYQVRSLCIPDNKFRDTYLHYYYSLRSTEALSNNNYASCAASGKDMNLKLVKGKDCLLQFIGEWGEGELTLKFK